MSDPLIFVLNRFSPDDKDLLCDLLSAASALISTEHGCPSSSNLAAAVALTYRMVDIFDKYIR